MPAGIIACTPSGEEVFNSSQVVAATYAQRVIINGATTQVGTTPNYNIDIKVPWLDPAYHLGLNLRCTDAINDDWLFDMHGMPVIYKGGFTMRGLAVWHLWYYRMNYYIDFVRFA